MHGAVEWSMRLYHSYTCENMYRLNTTYISPSRSANGAPPCRTPHARDAAGAAPNLGAIYPGPYVPSALPLPPPASSAA
jgi:hypothetical protein